MFKNLTTETQFFPMTSGYKRADETYSIYAVCSAELRHESICFLRQMTQCHESDPCETQPRFNYYPSYLAASVV